MACTATGKITVSSTKSTSGTVTILDGTTTVVAISASGTVDTSTSKTSSKQVGSATGKTSSGKSYNITVTVTYDPLNTANNSGWGASAAGTYDGSSLGPVPVTVDPPHGVPHHQR